MKKRLLWLMFAALAVTAPAVAGAGMYYGFQIGVSNAPPPRIAYIREPDLYYVPSSRVYVVEDSPYDVFRYGNSWYMASDNGWWYRAPRYGGPYRAVDVRYVPRPVFLVPKAHWKHYRGGNYSANSGRYRYDDDHGDHDRGHSKSKGKGRGHHK